ncbi:MAG: PIN domain-containing protein [Intrasporangium sp.]|uniref:PIN domain-containing protein n=1 Tax=Intrasporangium sp. TaxID=1925024 RepID=UPI00264766A9|nr:PIN domain-containing protein [Intrasporangium sp.]MDN5796369.1 PIN domain-containing protein [Intrasporangium sp.]
MITLDAGVLIALFDALDAHHEAAEALLAANIGKDDLTIGPINQAEVLVRAAREGRDQQMASDLVALGVCITALPHDAGPRLARLRATTSAKMPDCCVLLTAQQTGSRIATFDVRLAEAATGLGLELVR